MIFALAQIGLGFGLVALAADKRKSAKTMWANASELSKVPGNVTSKELATQSENRDMEATAILLGAGAFLVLGTQGLLDRR